MNRRPAAKTSGPQTPSAKTTAPQTAVPILPLHVGPHVLALEVVRVLEVHPGTGVAIPTDDPTRPTVRVDLRETFRVEAAATCETIVARADGQLGRGPGPRVALTVDRAERLMSVPLESFAPIPGVAAHQLEVDFLAGTVALPWPAGSVAFLLDPVRLARAVPSTGGTARG